MMFVVTKIVGACHGYGISVDLPNGRPLQLIRCGSIIILEGKAVLHYNAFIRRIHEDDPMTRLTVTAKGQVTLKKDVLQHLGIKPGDKIELDLLPDGRGLIKSARPMGTIKDFIGLLAGRTKKVATIEEINEATAQGWAGKR